MENETKPQLFIMDERLGDPIPLAEIKKKVVDGKEVTIRKPKRLIPIPRKPVWLWLS